MPGIAGIIGTCSRAENASELQAMIKIMMHEPFYTTGTYANERLHLGVGWTCHQAAFADCLPIWNETRDICLFFSGEDYGDRAERARLTAKGHACSPDDASYLVHWYEDEGIGFLGKLNGQFSGVLVDLRKEKVVLFNDRYGLGRIYFHQTKHGLYFSSEAKSILKVRPDERQLDPTGLAEFFTCGCVLQNRTLFAGMSLLPGGSMWTFSPLHDPRKESYFSRTAWEEQAPLVEDEYYERLKATFASTLPRYFAGKQRIGMSLTGGVDSRMIMAWEPTDPFKLPCYTFGGIYRECGDVRIARNVAKRCQQTHDVLQVTRKFLSEFPALAKKTVFLSDGVMDVSGSVDLYVNRMVREIAPVRMTGNYGDEILRGSVAFKPVSLYEPLFASEFAPLLRSAATTYADERQGRKLSFAAFKQIPWHHYSRLALESSQVVMRSPYLDNDLVALVYRVPETLIGDNAPALRLIEDGWPGLARIPTDRGIAYGALPIVRTARHMFKQFTFKAEYAYDYGMPQWLSRLDHAMARLRLERLFLGRHKFHHFRVWYRDDLANYVREILLSPRALSRGYLRREYVEEIVMAHIKGVRNYTTEIHRLLTAELMQRQLIESL